MDAATKNYKKGMQKYLELQEVLIESIKGDINRSIEDIKLEEKKIKLNRERLNIECKSWNLANQTLRELESEE